MLSVIINSKKHQIPISWQEVTWAQYLQLIKPCTLIDILSIFTGISKEKLLKVKITGLEPVLIALKFIEQGMNIPEKPIKLGKFKLPSDITLQSIEQYQILQKEIEKSSEISDLVGKIKFVANYAAIYCQALEEEFDYDRAITLAKEFDNYSCVEVLAAGTFFLNKLLSIDKNLPMSYLLTLTRWKNLRQDSRTSIKHSDSMQRSIKSRAMFKKMMKK